MDDVSKLKIENLIQNKDIEYSNLSAVTKLPWGENFKTKKQAPWQILPGAMNPFYYNLLGTARWLEFMLIYQRDKETEFVFAY